MESMVSVVYLVCTPACEAESMGSTPIGQPRKETVTRIDDFDECKRIATTDAGAQPQLATGKRRHGGACARAVVERGCSCRGRGRLPDVLLERLVEAAPARR